MLAVSNRTRHNASNQLEIWLSNLHAPSPYQDLSRDHLAPLDLFVVLALRSSSSLRIEQSWRHFNVPTQGRKATAQQAIHDRRRDYLRTDRLLLHLLHLFLGWEVTVNGMVVPIWASGPGFVIAAGLALMLWREARR
jgi:hypothetical protein